jgi:hypothetical protein
MARHWLARCAGVGFLLAVLANCSSESDSGSGSGSSGEGAGTGSSGTSSSTGGSCGGETWVCTPWQTSGSDDATRVCTDTANIGTTTCKPLETATLPALDLNYYKCNVEPVVDHLCSQLGCHGTEQGRPYRIYARGRLRMGGDTISDPAFCDPGESVSSDQCSGSASDCCRTGHTDAEWQANYDSARAFALDANLQPIAPGQEDTSELIAQPIIGGKAHAGIHMFAAGDPEHTTLSAWLGGATLASCDPGSN